MLIHIFPLNLRFLKPNFYGFLGLGLGLGFGSLWVLSFGFGFGFIDPNPTQKPTFFWVLATEIDKKKKTPYFQE